MMTLDQRLIETLHYIREHVKATPTVGLILGSGLGDFADSLRASTSLLTSDIPHYPPSSVEGHKGRLVFASVSGKEVLAFQGRVHLYESNSVESVLYPIYVAHRLGVETLLITNAAGGVNRSFAPGDLMVITDQINLTGEHITETQRAKPQRSSLYSNVLSLKAFSVAEAVGLTLKAGVYVGMKGPSYETAAEVEMVQRIGGDAVGMSTVLEASLAGAIGMEVLGISCITNPGTGISTNKLSHTEVTEVGNRVKSSFALLLTRILEAL